MRQFVPILAILLPGLLVGEFLAFVQIYQILTPLLRACAALQGAGYLVVPTGPALRFLMGPEIPLAAGLLFTLSLAAGLSVFTFAVAWSAEFLAPRRHWVTWPAAGLWAGLLLFVNLDGPVLFPSLWVLCVPLVVWFSAKGKLPASRVSESPLEKLLHLVPIALLALIWLLVKGNAMFLDIRDGLLLSTPPGLAINDAYYRYTLPAAEVIKPLAARQIKTYSATPDLDAETSHRLAGAGWYPAPKTIHPNVRLLLRDDRMEILSMGTFCGEMAAAAFFADPVRHLKEQTAPMDKMGGFRTLILAALLLGFPTLLYICLFSFLRTILHWGFDRPTASLFASAICLLCGILTLVPVLRISAGPAISPKEISRALLDDAAPVRIRALRKAYEEKIPLPDPQNTKERLLQAGIAERYWTVALLGVTAEAPLWPTLLDTLADPHPNVVCKAVEALSRTGIRLHRQEEAAEAILRRLRQSDHWYVQWYAFRALKRLGRIAPSRT